LVDGAAGGAAALASGTALVDEARLAALLFILLAIVVALSTGVGFRVLVLFPVPLALVALGALISTFIPENRHR
jgi:hypothetical protein